MTPYDKILNKIAPTFYKLQTYRWSILDSVSILLHYLPSSLRAENVHVMYYLDVFKTSRDVYYYFSLGFHTLKEPKEIKVMLTTTNKVEAYIYAGIDEFIVNMVINNFSFENKQLKYSFSSITYKDIFIALVGKDMYDTIRENIK